MPLVSKNFADIITFTRASTATFVGSNGLIQSAAIDTPRFDYDPVTLAAKGLLIEESRANILTYSAVGPAGTGWTAVGTSTITYGQTAPDGSTNAVLFNDTDAATVAYMRQQPTVPNDTNTYCASAFVKQGTSGKFYLRVAFTGGTSTFGTNIFDFATLTWTGGGIFLSSGYQDVGGGWYRVWTTFANNGTGNTTCDIRIGATTTTVTDTGSVYFWGIQTEVGAFPTSYIPTTTTSLTRSQDVAKVNTLSPWFNATEGTLYAQVTVPSAVLTARSSVSIGRSTATTFDINVFVSRASDSAQNATIVDSSTQFTYAPAGAVLSSKGALAYKQNDSQAAFNGTASVVDTVCTIPTSLTTMYVGNTDGGSGDLNGHIQRITYYPRRLSQAELQTITT